MRRIITLLLLLGAFVGRAQEKAPFSLFTDRDFYTSGETILFNVFLQEREQSDIVTIDLVNTKGKILSGIHKKIDKNQANGFIYLPDSMQTGSYLLCASTRANPKISVKELFICNRFTGLAETTLLSKATGIIPDEEKPSNLLQVEGIKQLYKTREKAHLNLLFTAEAFSQIGENLSVSIAEYLPGFKGQSFSLEAKTLQNRKLGEKGIVVDGFAKDLVTGTPFSRGCIYLSVPDSIPWLDYYITGEDGYFNFQLQNYFGKIPVIVQGFDLEKKRLLKIVLNRNDSLAGGLPPFEPEPVPQELKMHAGATIEATTLGKIFQSRELQEDTSSFRLKHDYPFYGIPTETVYPHLFLDLPDFTEISRELLPGVKFRAFNRIPTLQILNPVTLNYFSEQPLLTLDGVPVHDLNVIRNMGSKDILRIEISRKERYFGNLAFPGVVAIYSAKPDFARLTEADDLIKVAVDTFQPSAVLASPQNQRLNEPDLRKVLLWNPSFKPEEKVKCDFETSDITGSFKLIVRAKTRDGSLIIHEQIFEVQ